MALPVDISFCFGKHELPEIKEATDAMFLNKVMELPYFHFHSTLAYTANPIVLRICLKASG